MHSADSRGHGGDEEKTPRDGAGAGGELPDDSTREPGEKVSARVHTCADK